jgi:plastocyanin
MHTVRKSSLALAVALAACGGDGNGGTPPTQRVFTSLRITPANPAMVDGDTVQLTATPFDQNNAAMTGLGTPTFERLSGTAVSVSASGRVIADQQGTAQVRATLTSGTTTRMDTIDVNVTALGLSAGVTAAGNGQTFSPASVKIATTGSVTWSFPGPETHNVTFDGTAPPGGNIGDKNSGTESRNFVTAGTYNYHCTRHGGMNGSVIVRTP